MTIQISTGLKAALVTLSGVQGLMDGGVIEVFGGTRPATPDAPAGETVLGRITQDGVTWYPFDSAGGLRTISTLPGVLQKEGVWMFNGLTSGTATWFRWYWGGYDSKLETEYYPRLDGDVGEDMILANAAISLGLQFYINQFTLTM